MIDYEYDTSDFIIEKRVEYQPSWGNSRIVYRIMRWDEQSKRRTFEGDFFWLVGAQNRLRHEFGIEKPEEIPIVDLEK